MKLKTSYSEWVPFRKDITRFAPVWGLYLAGMLLVIFETTQYQSGNRLAVNFVGYVGQLSGFQMIYAGIAALMLFGDLYTPRMCYALHAMPQRRERWFFSHGAAGLCFSLVPNLLCALWLMIRLESLWYLALYWLLALQLQYLFFFGAAVFSAHCAGNRLGMPAVYALVNFFSLLIYWMICDIYMPMLTGVSAELEFFSLFCPVVELTERELFAFTFDAGQWQYEGLTQNWGYLAAAAGIGLLLMGLGLLLYRRRDLESAGDFTAFRKMEPVMCVLLTLCTGMVFAAAGYSADGHYLLWLAVGLILGFFGSRMLLERRVRVFRPRAFLFLGILMAVLGASLLTVKLDAFGIVRWVPEAEQVTSVTVSNREYSYASNYVSETLTEPEDIQNVLRAHEDILAHLDDSPQNTHYVVIEYTLKNGRTVKREYYASVSGENYEILSQYFYRTENLFGYSDWHSCAENVSNLYVDGTAIWKEAYGELLEALWGDCENGALTMDRTSDWLYAVEFNLQMPSGESCWRSLYIHPGCEKTLLWIEENLPAEDGKEQK